MADGIQEGAGTLDARGAMLARELRQMFGNPMSEAEILAETRKAKRFNPLPCIRSGGKRPHTRVYPSVFHAYLNYLQGVADYAEVEQAARRVSAGALQ